MVSKRSLEGSLNRETFSLTLSSLASSYWYVKGVYHSFGPLAFVSRLLPFSEIYSCIRTSHICPPSQILAAAVPGDEEDYPCISRWPVIRNQSLRAFVRCERGESDIESSLRNLRTCAPGGFCFLHTFSKRSAFGNLIRSAWYQC